jgi:hypothetical protein
MTSDLVRKLLALSAAVAADGGDGVVRALAQLLEQLLHFDDAELVLSLATDQHRRPLTENQDCLAGEETLAYLQTHGSPLRIDELSEVEHLPRTREHLCQRHYRSLLAMPMSPWGGMRGVLVLVARQPCAFAGVSLNVLGPIVGMAGLALYQSLRLSGLQGELERFKESLQQSRDANATISNLEQTIFQKRQEGEAARSDLSLAKQELELREATIARLQEELRREREASPRGPSGPSDQRRDEVETLRSQLRALEAQLVAARGEGAAPSNGSSASGGAAPLADPPAGTVLEAEAGRGGPAPSSPTLASATHRHRRRRRG